MRFRVVLAVAVAVAVVVGGLALTFRGPEKIKFGYCTSVGHAAPMVADQKGFFEDYGLDVEGKPGFVSGGDVSAALYAGELQFGTMGDTPSINSVVAGKTIILSTIGGGPKRERIMYHPKENIKDFEDLKGKTIAVPIGTSMQGAVYWAAEKAGYSSDWIEKNLEWKNLGGTEQILALEHREVDAIANWEPYVTMAKLETETSPTPMETLCTMENTGTELPMFVIVREDFARENPEKVENVLKAINKGVEFIEDNPEEAAEIVREASGMEELSVDDLIRSMNRHWYETKYDESIESSLIKTANFLVKAEKAPLETVPDFDKVVDNRYLENALK